MSFTGLSSDEHGSIIYDGEKFIVNVPVGDEQLEHFKPDGSIPVVYTHPSHHQNQQASTQGQPSGGNQPSQSSHDHGDRTGSQSSEQGSSSKSDEQGSKGSSQTEDSNGADRGKDETGAQDELPDFEDGQEDFYIPGLMAGLGPNRLFGLSNPDVISVQQDIERRPLTFQRCFEHSESPQMALEFIYAEPPKLSESELKYCQQVAAQQIRIRAGMADGGAKEADVTGFTNSRSILRYEDRLENKYGFAIEWGEASDETNKAGQLNNVARSVAHIVSYLAEQVYDGDQDKALETFQQHFAQSKHGQLQVYLGANTKAGGASYGRVPLPASSDKDLDKMFLGSAVKIATIVHEFGHVIDRSIGIASRFLDYHDAWYDDTNVGLNDTIYDLAIEGFAGKQVVNEEIWPDLFMTAVLDPSNPGIHEAYQVWSTTSDHYNAYLKELEDDLAAQGYDRLTARLRVIGSFYDCDVHGNCDWRPVKWQDDDKGAAAKAHFPELLGKFLAV